MKSRWETRPLNPERPKYSGPRNPRLRNTGVNVDTDQIIVGDNPGALGESGGGEQLVQRPGSQLVIPRHTIEA